jgi:hypothetical protein
MTLASSSALIIFVLVEFAHSLLDNYSTILSLNHLIPSNIYKIGNSLDDQRIDWYLGDEIFISIPNSSLRVDFKGAVNYCASICQTCQAAGYSKFRGLVSLQGSEYNIALFNYLTNKTFVEQSDAIFWIGLYQYDTSIEPEFSYKWAEPDYSEHDESSPIRLWKKGEPNDRDEISGESHANCACYDSQDPTGIFDCSCASLLIPVCMIKSRIMISSFTFSSNDFIFSE